MEKEYALYKGEKLLSMGTIREIAEELNVQEVSIKHYMTPTYAKRTSERNGRRLVELD